MTSSGCIERRQVFSFKKVSCFWNSGSSQSVAESTRSVRGVCDSLSSGSWGSDFRANRGRQCPAAEPGFLPWPPAAGGREKVRPAGPRRRPAMERSCRGSQGEGAPEAACEPYGPGDGSEASCPSTSGGRREQVRRPGASAHRGGAEGEAGVLGGRASRVPGCRVCVRLLSDLREACPRRSHGLGRGGPPRSRLRRIPRGGQRRARWERGPRCRRLRRITRRAEAGVAGRREGRLAAVWGEASRGG